MLRENRPVPESRLREIHEVLRRILVNDDTFITKGDSGALGMAAARMISLSRQHDARQSGIDLGNHGAHSSCASANCGGPSILY